MSRNQSVLLRVGAVVVCLFAVATQAQDNQAEIKRLRDSLCQADRAATAQDGEAALARLKQAGWSASSFQGPQRIAYFQVEIYAALAVGDGARAATKLKEFQTAVPDAREALEAAYAVALATGDSAAGQAALKQLADAAKPEERKALDQRRRWFKAAGAEAPDATIDAEDGTKLSVRKRNGIVLVVDFWNSHGTSSEYARALRALFEAHRADLHVQFVGVNNDGQSGAQAARKFARDAGFIWPQHYEGMAANAPLTNKAFAAGSPPWTVLVDGAGRIRAVGSAGEPAFQYALRVALADATDKFAPPKPAAKPEAPKPPDTDRHGVKRENEPGEGPQPGDGGKPGEAGKPGAGGKPGEAKPGQGKPGEGGKEVSKGDLPSNDEAESLLREARAYIRTGMITKAKELLRRIIHDYPGTRQAKEAQERLDLLK